MKIFGRSVSAIATLAVTVMALFTTVNPASAAGLCRAATCNGKDPQTMGCSADAVTLSISPQPGTAGAGWQEVVELRYSRRCAARWSRVTSRLSPSSIRSTYAYMAGHPSTRVTKLGAAGQLVWSRMWTTGSACGNSISRTDPTYHPVHCTP